MNDPVPDSSPAEKGAVREQPLPYPPHTVNMIFYGLVLLCAGLFGADWFYHRHATLAFEGWPGFYGGYGFLGGVVLVLLARLVRALLQRGEDYYD